MTKPILGTGLSGLVGSRIVELLSSEFEFEDLSYDTGVDITNRDQVFSRIKSSQASWILHLAAKADVDGCEKDKSQGKEGGAWKINVEGTRNIIEAANESAKRVLYISTDFVFDGTKEYYTEADLPNPINWYGLTKYEAEKIVLQESRNLVVRLAYPYRARYQQKKDFVHAIVNKLINNETIPAVTDHVMTPTFIDDLAKALNTLIQKEVFGIYHVVGSTSLTPFQAVELVAEVFGFSKKQIKATTIDQYYQNRAPRPYNLSLKNDKISSLGVTMRPFRDGLFEIKKQGII